MRGRWTFILGAFAMVICVAGPGLSAQPPGRSVETEAIIVPPDGLGDPGMIAPDREGFDTQTPESESLDSGSAGTETELPEVEYDADKLPPPVRRLRQQIIDVAEKGDIEKLRLVFEANGGPPAISYDGAGDAIDAFRSLSGDPEGREILAILIEVLEAGYVHVDVGTPEEVYVWPYFARYPLEQLNGPQMVELFKLLTAGDYEEMKSYGVYLFFRVGIDPNGVWRYFLAGD